ncbi:MAG: tetratricopeptide repeat protein [Bacteroidia bacterium]
MANSCNNLGDMYRMLGNFRDSERYLQYSLEIRQRTSGWFLFFKFWKIRCI